MSARLIIVVQIFDELLMRRSWHPAVSPNFETECSDSAEHRHDRAKEKPDRNCHVLGRFPIFGAVTKWTRARLLNGQHDEKAQSREQLFHVMMRSRFIFR